MSEPDLSVILVSSDGGAGLARSLRHLAAQRAAGRIEVIIAVPDPARVRLPQRACTRLDIRLVAADLSTSARARVAAIRAARAGIVAFTEDHAFPEDDRWAERLIAGFRPGVAAVGPVMTNANPDTPTSWAVLALEYGPFLAAAGPGPVPFLPGHNSAYRRALLCAKGARLADLLEAEYVLQVELRAEGFTLRLDPAIRVAHLNYSVPWKAVRLCLLAGRMFAASRAQGWPAWRRMGFALLFWAIALKRLPLAFSQLQAVPGNRRMALRTLPALARLVAANSLGEGIGYALGDGGQRHALAALEYDRWRNLRQDERHLAA